MNGDEGCVAMIGLVVLAVVISIVTYDNGKSSGYRQGQIDALTGTVKYELVSHPDGTKTWESKKGTP